MTFRETLLAEIAKQKETIERFRDHETGPHMMSHLRQERLDLLEELLEFEPSPQTVSASHE